MEGVMVLNTIETANYNWGWSNWYFLFLLPLTLGIYLTYFYWINRRRWKGKFQRNLGIILIIFSIVTPFIKSATHTITYDNTYQVLLDSSVEMETFRQDFEVIEQIGITYMVRQK